MGPEQFEVLRLLVSSVMPLGILTAVVLVMILLGGVHVHLAGPDAVAAEFPVWRVAAVQAIDEAGPGETRSIVAPIGKRSALMKTLVLVLAFASIGSAADAARAPKRSVESCTELAQQRGFTGGNTVNVRAKATFIRACMAGKQA